MKYDTEDSLEKQRQAIYSYDFEQGRTLSAGELERQRKEILQRQDEQKRYETEKYEQPHVYGRWVSSWEILGE